MMKRTRADDVGSTESTIRGKWHRHVEMRLPFLGRCVQGSFYVGPSGHVSADVEPLLNSNASRDCLTALASSRQRENVFASAWTVSER